MKTARRLPLAALALAALALVLSGCSGAADTSPRGVVEQALRHVENKDTEALTGLACEARKDEIVGQFDLTSGLGGVLPIDIDTDALLETIEIDASKVVATEKSVEGDAAVVTLAGSIGITVDEDAFKDVMREFATSQGIEVDEAQLNTMLLMLGSFTEAIPLNLDVGLVREGGAWKICS